MPDQVAAARCGRRGSTMASTAGAHWSSALHGYGASFLVFSLPMDVVECEELTKGVFYKRGGSRARRVVARFKLQPSATVGECSEGWLTTRLGQMGATQNVEHRHQVDGARGASHVVW
jgi:hypothetical protein